MSDRYAEIGKILKTVVTQTAVLGLYVAVSQTVTNFVNHKFRQYTTKKKEDTKIEVKPVEASLPAPVVETKPEPVLETKPEEAPVAS